MATLEELARDRVSTLRRAALLISQRGERPCDCESCTCGDIRRAQSVAAWDESYINERVINAMADTIESLSRTGAGEESPR